MLNGPGQVAFIADLVGVGLTTDNDTGLYAGLPGDLTKIIREGDIVDSRTVSSIGFLSFLGSGGEDGRGRSFNDSGQLAYYLRFTDGSSGIFTSTLSSGPPTDSGDFDHDGDIDGNDFLVWQRGGSPHGNGAGSGDLAPWQTQYGNTLPLTANEAAVPEPCPLSFLFIGLTIYLATPRCGVKYIVRGSECVK